MEAQSQHLPIQFACGEAATVGLGMGHFALRAVAKEEVDSLDVYEQDPRVISLFRSLFSKRPGFDKIRFIEGDARETLPASKRVYDTLYADPYPVLCDDDAVEDLKLFAPLLDDPAGYCWWGRELVFLNAIYQGLIDTNALDWPTGCFLHVWQRENNLRHKELDVEYCESVLTTLEDLGLEL
jgi:hypothetical protein